MIDAANDPNHVAVPNSPKTTSPPDTSAKKPKPRKPPATPKPKRPKSGALWTNAAGEHYLRIDEATWEALVKLQKALAERGFTLEVATDTLAEEVNALVGKLPHLVAGKLTRALEGLKGGVGEGA